MSRDPQDKSVHIVGGGLAGCEAALVLAQREIPVTLFEMRPHVSSPAHKTEHLAELVCSNSFKSERPDSAAGQLKHEMQKLKSPLYEIMQKTRVPAGGALAVDRVKFSEAVEEALEAHPFITIVREEVADIDLQHETIIAAGPLCSDKLACVIKDLVGGEQLSFFDAAAPIVETASLDFDILFAESRYGKGEGADYLNAPLNKEEYEQLIYELTHADRVILKDFEQKDLFQACQPVEEVARAGKDALRFGALKPVGLVDPRTGRRPYAVVQLRAENTDKTAYNLVGFQTNLTFGEQKRIFSQIPGLKDAEFARYGVMHRNTFLDTPRVLDSTGALPGHENIRFAGQITGTEGYMEAVASGHLAALNTYAHLNNLNEIILPKETVFGALMAYATSPETQPYQPMHVNFGIIPPLTNSDNAPKRLKKRERYAAYVERAQQALSEFCLSRKDVFYDR